jgi:16S rRNA (cytosine967-C5)-methyltransferase
MRLGGRISAAIEVLDEMRTRNRPASDALRDWGNAHRFAGSGDRNAIGNLVYDSLRQYASSAWLMDDEEPSSVVFASLVRQWGMDVATITSELDGDKFAPEIPVARLEAMAGRDFTYAPAHDEADIPEWCMEHFQENFGDDWVKEAKALAERAPLDLRVNTLKADVSKVLKALSREKAKKSPISLNGIRINPGRGDSRMPNVQADAAFQKGWFEVQDEGSQIAAELVFAREGEQILDFCAGAGGKTLALAALMNNKGQIHAHDADRHRLAPIHERLKRAGTRNVQVHDPREGLKALAGKMDRVLIDAPCSGSGTWRRKPDAKWRLTPDTLEMRMNEQKSVLDEAMKYVRPGGFLCYVTCSVFPCENEEQIYAFGERHNKDGGKWDLLSAGGAWEELYGYEKPKPWSADMDCITLSPASTGTDGFFFAVLQRLA